MLDLAPYSPLSSAAQAVPQHAGAPASDVPTTRVRVVVADDHPLYRQGIVRALQADSDFAVVGVAADGTTALALIRRLQPDVALLDVRMPGLDGIDIIHSLARQGPDVPIVLLSAFTDRPLVAAGMEAGAVAYVNKTADRDAICLQVATAARSSGTFAPRHLAAYHDQARGGPRRFTARLTIDEHRLLELAGKGLGKPDLARALDSDETVVHRRLAAILGKLNADSLPDAIAKARTLGVIH